MIVIYGYTNEEKVKLFQEFFSRIQLEVKFIDKSANGLTLKEVLEKDVVFNHLPTEETAIFVSGENREEVGSKVLSALSRGQIGFDYQVLVEEELMPKTVETILGEHRVYRAFLKKLGYLQQLIDGTKSLRIEDYDPDDWSELKLAVANANDYLDSLVNEREANDSFDQKDNEKIAPVIDELKKAMKLLLDKKK